MNRFILGGIGIGIVSIAGVGWYMGNQPTTEQADEVVVSPPAAEEPTVVGEQLAATDQGTALLQDFLARDGSGQCTFSGTYDDGVSDEGEFWFTDGQLRVEAVNRIAGEVYTANLINDGARVYIWGGSVAGTQAMVMDVAVFEASPEADTGSTQLDLEQAVSYECTNWTPTAITFTPPADIVFIDMSDLMQGAFQGELRGVPEGLDF